MASPCRATTRQIELQYWRQGHCTLAGCRMQVTAHVGVDWGNKTNQLLLFWMVLFWVVDGFWLDISHVKWRLKLQPWVWWQSLFSVLPYFYAVAFQEETVQFRAALAGAVCESQCEGVLSMEIYCWSAQHSTEARRLITLEADVASQRRIFKLFVAKWARNIKWSEMNVVPCARFLESLGICYIYIIYIYIYRFGVLRWGTGCQAICIVAALGTDLLWIHGIIESLWSSRKIWKE